MEAVDECLHQVALQENRVGAGLSDGLVQHRVGIAGERDQAEVRVILAQPRDGGHAVDERHVQVDHDRVGRELVRKLDRGEPVGRSADHRQLGLVLDERLQRLEEGVVVVRE